MAPAEDTVSRALWKVMWMSDTGRDDGAQGIGAGIKKRGGTGIGVDTRG